MKWYTNLFTLLMIALVALGLAFVIEFIWHLRERNPFAWIFGAVFAWMFAYRIYLLFKKKKNRANL